MTIHEYLSTSCWHEAEELIAGNDVRAEELHAYCASNTGLCGAKTPGKCKFCDSHCSCPAHGRGED